MKIEPIGKNLFSACETTLPLALISHRIGEELHDLVRICRNVEDALGVVIGAPTEVVDKPIMAIQGIDRMRQTLEDLARLSVQISQLQLTQSDVILKRDILNSVVLNGLAGRLTTSRSHGNIEEPELQNEIWK